MTTKWTKAELHRRACQIAEDNGLTMDDWSIMADSAGRLTLEVSGYRSGKTPGFKFENVQEPVAA